MTSRRTVLTGGLAAIALSACARDAELATRTAGTGSANPTSAVPTASVSTSPSAEPGGTTSSSAGQADSWLAKAGRLSLPEQVGQLFMVATSTTVLDGRTRETLEEHQLGSLLLLGDKLGGRTDVAVLTSELSSLQVRAPVLVAVDQEGGRIQRLKGDGFSTIPAATEQARLAPGELARKWEAWGKELARAGVRYNLAPVADVVPRELVAKNAPVGQLQRHYGTDPTVVAADVTAVVEGLTKAGVASSAKHFPGLGRVSANTDFGEAVDTVTTAEDLSSFQVAMDAGVSSVMVSSAIYKKLDPDNQAAFSRRIVTDLLRKKLGWQKVVISDDLGAAASVQHIKPADRALRFFTAGGDLLVNADVALVREMVTAVLDKAGAVEAFAKDITTKCARVLELKGSLPAQ